MGFQRQQYKRKQQEQQEQQGQEERTSRMRYSFRPQLKGRVLMYDRKTKRESLVPVAKIRTVFQGVEE